MNNYISLLLNTLVFAGTLTKKDAEALNHQLQSATLPDDFESAYQMMKSAWDKAGLESPELESK